MISDEQIKQIFVNHGFKLTNESGDDLKPYVYEAARALIKAIEQPSAGQSAEPYGWNVPPMTQIYRGEFAEADAKAEARRCGGTAKAIPLYAVPPAIDAEIKTKVLELCDVVENYTDIPLAKQIREMMGEA